MATYIRGSNPIWSYVDLTGKQFDDTYFMFVLQNDLPYIPAVVYHDPDGNVAWTNPIQFLANGTLPDDIYFNPGTDTDPDVYRLEFRKGNTQQDPLIYLVENYVPGIGAGDLPDIGFTTDNQITNAQFSVVNFFNTYSTTSASNLSLNIAPGWVLDLTASGTGSVTLTQLKLNNSTPARSNPSYALEINISGWSSAILKQRFNGNGVLWAGKQVSCALTAEVASGANTTITGQLVDSDGNNLGIMIPSTTTVTGDLQEYTGVPVLVPYPSANADTPPDAWVEFQLILQPNVNIVLTSFQLVAGDLALTYSYEQDTLERQVDHTFHYWQPYLNFKPISSYCVGWDFALNPAQWGSTIAPQAIGANKSYYAWDNTIVFQSADSGFNIARGSAANDLVLTAATNTQGAIIQYFTGAQAKDILFQAANGLSVNVACLSSVTQTMCVSIYWSTSAPPTLTSVSSGIAYGDSIVSTLDANGHPNSVAAGWNEIENVNGQAIFTTNSSTNYMFNGFIDDAAFLTGNYVAIVVGTSLINSSNNVEFLSVGFSPGHIATIPAPQSTDEVLRACQYNYETSFSSVADFIVNPLNNTVWLPQNTWNPGASTGNPQSNPTPGWVPFKVSKRANPNLLFYSIAQTLNNLSANLYVSNAGTILNTGPTDKVLSTFFNVTTKINSFYLEPKVVTALLSTTASSSNYLSSAIAFHYIADCRPGVV